MGTLLEAAPAPTTVPTMTVTEITLSHGMTINLGKFNSARGGRDAQASLSGGMDERRPAEQLHAKVIEALDKGSRGVPQTRRGLTVASLFERRGRSLLPGSARPLRPKMSEIFGQTSRALPKAASSPTPCAGGP